MAKQNKPAIRFKGFTDAWEQRKVGEVSESYSGGTPSVGVKEYYGGQIPFIRSAEINSEITELFLTEEGLKNSSARLVAVGDILYALYGATSGEVGRARLKGAINQAILAIKPHTDYDSEYLAQWLRKSKHSIIDTYLQGGQGNLSGTIVKELSVDFPSLKEQKAIGGFFRQLDNLITLHQRKYDKLQVLKKAMLEKMFPKNGSSVPEIRFKGFTDAWEQRKLGDNIVEYTEVTTENNQYPPLTSSRKGIFLQTEYFAGNQIASDDNTGYNIVPYGYFTYRHMSDDEVFHFNINDIVEKGIVSTLYPVFTTDENLDSRYLQYQLNYGHEFAKFAILQKQGGSRTYMYLNKLRQLHLTMPNHVEEQKAISSFFMNLDHLITLHQRELEKLQNIKKSMLEKMFV